MVYPEIKRVTLKFPQELPKEDPTKIIAYISRYVNLTNQVEKALAVFKERCNYLKPDRNSIKDDNLRRLRITGNPGVGKTFFDNVYEFKDLPGKREAWYIVDSRKPSEFHAKMIVVCSPQKRYYHTFDNLGTVVRYVTVWSRAEIEKMPFNSVNERILDFVGESTDDNSSSCRLVHIRTNVPQVYRRTSLVTKPDKGKVAHQLNQK
nr:6905_t:CDS:2 [Entrophospora candida]